MAETDPATSHAAAVPQYVLDYAPLVYIYSKELYQPSSIAAQLLNTRPVIDGKDQAIPSPPLTLSNLAQLNDVGNKGGADVWLTSTHDITSKPTPQWLLGIKPDQDGKTGTGDDGVSTVVIVHDKGDGNVDAFYVYFFAFNWGGVVLENQLGNHVGDWEHNMIRFSNGVPKAVWYSQHGNGQAFDYKVLKKDPKTGKRPLVYCANGSHALFATPGVHDHTFPNLNLPFKFIVSDDTDAKGPLYDPLTSAWFYQYRAGPIAPGKPGSTVSGEPSTATPTEEVGSTETSPAAAAASDPAPAAALASSSAPAPAAAAPPPNPNPPPTFTFTPLSPTPSAPTSFLYFRGRWGDAQYSDKDKRQKQLAGNRKFVGGPTGPADKQLTRKNVWPEGSFAKGQKIRGELSA